MRIKSESSLTYPISFSDVNMKFISHKLNPKTGLYDRRWWFKLLPKFIQVYIITNQDSPTK